MITNERVGHAAIFIFAVSSTLNIAGYLKNHGHNVGFAWALAIALGLIVVSMSFMLSKSRDKQSYAFKMKLFGTLAICLLSGWIQTLAYMEHSLNIWLASLFGFGLPLVGEMILALSIAEHEVEQRDLQVQNIQENNEQKLLLTYSKMLDSVDVTKAKQQFQSEVDELFIAMGSKVLNDLMPELQQSKLEHQLQIEHDLNLQLKLQLEALQLQLNPSTEPSTFNLKGSTEGHLNTSTPSTEDLQLKSEGVQLKGSTTSTEGSTEAPEDLQLKASTPSTEGHLKGSNRHLKGSDTRELKGSTEDLNTSSEGAEGVQLNPSTEGSTFNLKGSTEGFKSPSTSTEDLQLKYSTEGVEGSTELQLKGSSGSLEGSTEGSDFDTFNFNLNPSTSTEGRRFNVLQVLETAYLNAKPSTINKTKIASLFDVSSNTIKNDIKWLEQNGHIQLNGVVKIL